MLHSAQAKPLCFKMFLVVTGLHLGVGKTGQLQNVI